MDSAECLIVSGSGSPNVLKKVHKTFVVVTVFIKTLKRTF